MTLAEHYTHLVDVLDELGVQVPRVVRATQARLVDGWQYATDIDHLGAWLAQSGYCKRDCTHLLQIDWACFGQGREALAAETHRRVSARVLPQPRRQVLTPACPVCHSTHVHHEQPDWNWDSIEVPMCCNACAAEWTLSYEIESRGDIRYGQPSGPVFLTHCPQAALTAWEAEPDWQVICTNGELYAVGYEPSVSQGGRGSRDGWRQTCPELLPV